MKPYSNLITFFMLIISLLAACKPQIQIIPENEAEGIYSFADPIAENLLRGLQLNEYQTFSRDFDQTMLENMDETSFEDLRNTLLGNNGDIISHRHERVERYQEYYLVYYDLGFSTAMSVTLRLVLTVSEPHMVSGLWFP